MDFVTVDWDFFVPEKAMWDMAHKESEMFLTLLWAHRGGLIKEAVTSGEEKDFWKSLGKLPKNAFVSDSHAYAYAVTGEADRVVLFDAHHDCWQKEKDGLVYCDNWLRVWLEGDESREALWVYPKHVIENWGEQEVPEDLRDRVETLEWNGSVDLDKVKAVHICRSGCWTPPWLDADFIKFIGHFSRVRSMQDGVWDATKPRWTDEVFDGVVKSHEQMMAHFKTIQAAQGNQRRIERTVSHNARDHEQVAVKEGK